jgi:hypothetical protein
MSKVVYNMIHQYLKNKISSDLELLENYVIEADLQFQKSKSKFEKVMQDDVKNYKGNIEDVYGFYENDYYMHQEFFPNMLYATSLASLHSIFESSLKQICITFGKQLSKSVFDEKKGYVKDSYLYISNELNVDLSTLKQEQNYLEMIQQIRNKIIHNEGKIAIGNKQLVNFINANNSLELKSNQYVLIKDPKIIFESIEKVNTLINYIFLSLKT